MAGDDVFVQITPSRDRSFAVFAGDLQAVLVRLVCEIFSIANVVHNNCSQVAHSLLGHSKQLFPILAELDSFDGSGELPRLDAFSRLHIPQFYRVVGGAGSDKSRVGRHVHSPDCTLMAVVCPQSFSVAGIPGTDNFIFGYRKQQVAVFVVLDLVDRSLLDLGQRNPGLIFCSRRTWPCNNTGLILEIVVTQVQTRSL